MVSRSTVRDLSKTTASASSRCPTPVSRVEPPRRPPLAGGHVAALPPRLQPASVLQPVEALEHGARPQPGMDREGVPVPVVAAQIGHEGAQTWLVSAYDPLHEYLARARRDELLMIFAEIERLVASLTGHLQVAADGRDLQPGLGHGDGLQLHPERQAAEQARRLQLLPDDRRNRVLGDRIGRLHRLRGKRELAR